MKLVILDRDGVINFDSDHYIKSTDEWRPIPGSIEAIARLTQSGHHVVVATNQSGVGRGLFDMAALNAMHAKMHRLVSQSGGRIDAERFNTPLSGVPAIGDALRDLQAAHSAGAKPMLVLTGKGEKTRAGGGLPPGTTEHADLAAAVDTLLG